MHKFTSFLVGVALVLSAYACSVPYDSEKSICDPEGYRPSEFCLKKFAADAGTDAEAGSGGSAGGSSLRNSCEPTGRCLDVPSGENAGYWTEKPLAVWTGPADKLDGMKCPGDEKVGTPNEQFRLYRELDAPSATCDACECEAAEGTCTGLPSEIKIQAGPCGEMNVESITFGGPTNWDGSCTNQNAMPTGKMCGAEPCAQSVRASVLPSPTNEACKPKVARPVSKTSTKWKIGVLACSAAREENDCASTKMNCVNHLVSPEWQHCIHRVGAHAECPANYPYNAAVAYRGAVIDDRGCNECACGTAQGGGCLATMAVYDDGACSQSPAAVNNVSSFGELCFNVQPPGRVLGSKTMSQPTYMAGACVVTGGDTFGKAIADEKDAVTFCCAPPFDQVE